MNSATKPFASLSSGLLARKGAARPAMRPQGFGPAGTTLDDLGWNDLGYEPPKPTVVAVRDADHDAFGHAIPEPRVRNPVAALTPAESPVHDQQSAIAIRLAGNDHAAREEEYSAEPGWQASPLVLADAPPPRPEKRSRSETGGKKVAFTLRLDAARHLRLRLACAVSGRSAQQLLITAVDELLASMPGLDSLAERAPSASHRTKE